jgi:signal transduction histidine kinase
VSERGGSPWAGPHGSPWAGRSRPSWWPEGETWPPRRRVHFPRRLFFVFGLAFIAFLVVMDVIVVSLVSLVARVLGIADLAPPGVVAAVAALLFVFTFFVTSGPIRRVGMPMARLVDAVGRVADGDYTVRVDARGPRAVRRLVLAFNEMVERLATADERRRRLLADVTHELRTPLSVVQGQLEGALDGVYPRDDAHLRAVLDETRHMARIIEDLRTLSLAESGALALHREPTDLSDVIEDATDAYRASADAEGVTLAADVEAGLPPVDADPTRVRQVLENLVSNALRYTPRGGRVDVSASADGADMVAVVVRDTGRGIAAEDLARIFDRFQRSADSSGSGLGLAIARDLVHAHGGEISAASDGDGRGTTVRFTLPVAERA